MRRSFRHLVPGKKGRADNRSTNERDRVRRAARSDTHFLGAAISNAASGAVEGTRSSVSVEVRVIRGVPAGREVSGALTWPPSSASMSRTVTATRTGARAPSSMTSRPASIQSTANAIRESRPMRVAFQFGTSCTISTTRPPTAIAEAYPLVACGFLAIIDDRRKKSLSREAISSICCCRELNQQLECGCRKRTLSSPSRSECHVDGYGACRADRPPSPPSRLYTEASSSAVGRRERCCAGRFSTLPARCETP